MRKRQQEGFLLNLQCVARFIVRFCIVFIYVVHALREKKLWFVKIFCIIL
jgi:hypothetical protein